MAKKKRPIKPEPTPIPTPTEPIPEEPVIIVPVPPAPPPIPPSGGLISQANFSYIGSFEIPQFLDDGSDTRAGGLDGGYGMGLAVRNISGVSYLMSTADSHQIALGIAGQPYRFSIPTLSLGPPYNQATILKRYNNIYNGKRVGIDDLPFDGTHSGPIGIYYDHIGGKYYSAYKASEYNSSSGYFVSLLVSTLNEGASGVGNGSGVTQGGYKFDSLGFKGRAGGILQIPTDFANTYLSGKRIGVGFGGYNSLYTVGDTSIGPQLIAIDPPSGPHLSSIPWTPLIKYSPSAEFPAAGLGRANRPASIPLVNYFDGWPGTKWSWVDNLLGTAVWINYNGKVGILFCPTFGTGVGGYAGSGYGANGLQTWWVVYDPADVISVIQGSIQPYEIQPAAQWQVFYPVINYSLETIAIVEYTPTGTVTGNNATGLVSIPLTAHGFILNQRFTLTGADQAAYSRTYMTHSSSTANVLVGHSDGLNVSGPASGNIKIAKTWDGSPPIMLHGATFDSTTGILWVSVRTETGSGTVIMVHGYQLS